LVTRRWRAPEKNPPKSQGTPTPPRLWGKHAVAAALDNPERKVLRAWATRDAAASMNFPNDVAPTLADAADLGRLVPQDTPHQGVVIEVEPLAECWLDDILQQAGRARHLSLSDNAASPRH